ncbi:MAG: DUF3558 family protein [Actinomycetota bacterium]|nr:DUF3558 family protein [Actinomycetota bacterium]
MTGPKVFAACGALLTSALLLAACGGGTASGSPGAAALQSAASTAAGSSSDSGSSKAVDPCTLISQQEATTALGADPGPAVSNTLTCEYGATGGGPSITTGADPGSRMTYDQQRTLTGGSTPDDVSGVGDAAFLIAGADLPDITTIVFLKSSTVVRISLILPGSTSGTSIVTTLAKAAAGRM